MEGSIPERGIFSTFEMKPWQLAMVVVGMHAMNGVLTPGRGSKNSYTSGSILYRQLDSNMHVYVYVCVWSSKVNKLELHDMYIAGWLANLIINFLQKSSHVYAKL